MQFKDVIGQAHLKSKLVESIKNNRVHHAQLFLGDSGYGSLALALAYAQYLNCENPSEDDSCGKCGNCLKMYKLIHPDVHFSFPIVATKSKADDVDPKTEFYNQWRQYLSETAYPAYQEWIGKIGRENQQGNIPVSEARSIIRKLALKSYQGGYKVLIMWLPEYLGTEGNVLLKVLEEPTPNTIFILVAEDESKILNTILSRCQIMRIPRIDSQSLQLAVQELLDKTADEAAEISSLAEGSFRRVLEIADAGQNNYFDIFGDWMRACVTRNASKMYLWSESVGTLGRENLKNYLMYSLGLLRESLLLKHELSNISQLRGTQAEWIKDKLSPHITERGVILSVDLINKAHYHIERNANSKIILFDLSLQISKSIKLA